MGATRTIKLREISKTKDKFIRIPINFRFDLTITEQQLVSLVDRAIKDGIGDWGIIGAATRVPAKQRSKKAKVTATPHYTFPIEVYELDSNESHMVTREMAFESISKVLIDFPSALDTEAGYNLNLSNLSREDIDEIIQVAIYGEIRYKFV